MPAQLLSSSHGQTLVLTLSNPEHHQTLDPVLYSAGVEALNGAESNPDVRSVIITGADGMFCSGGNLQRLRAQRERDPQEQAANIEALHTWVETIRAYPKPVIAAVEGAAAGAGFSLALACDFIVAAREAVFVMAYCNVALSPDGGGSWSLSRLLPRQLATELLLCGERISGERLHAMGLVNRATTKGQALETALELAHKLNAKAPNAVAGIKQLIADAEHAELTPHLAAERDLFVKNLMHPNGGEGITAFLEKRPAQYR